MGSLKGWVVGGTAPQKSVL